MKVGLVVILFLLATVISSLLSRVVPGLPRPLVQIALGSAIGSLSTWYITLDPHLFFLMIVPPLLFYDGWRLPFSPESCYSFLPCIADLANLTALINFGTNWTCRDTASQSDIFDMKAACGLSNTSSSLPSK